MPFGLWSLPTSCLARPKRTFANGPARLLGHVILVSLASHYENRVVAGVVVASQRIEGSESRRTPWQFGNPLERQVRHRRDRGTQWVSKRHLASVPCKGVVTGRKRMWNSSVVVVPRTPMRKTPWDAWEGLNHIPRSGGWPSYRCLTHVGVC